MDREKEKSVDELLDNTKEIVPEAEGFDFQGHIESERLKFRQEYSKSRTRSNISMFVSVGLIAAAFILLLQKGNLVCSILGYSIGGVTIVGMLIFFLLTRRIFPNATERYVHEVIVPSYNAHTFKSGEYKELKTDRHDTFDSSEILVEGLFSDISRMSSRNIVNGKYKDRSFKVGDLAMLKAEGRSSRNLFVGKYVSYVNDLHFEDRYVIVLKNKDEEKVCDTPNAIDDLVVLYEEDNLTLYGKEGAKYKDDLGSKFISLVKDIKVEGELLNLSIVLWAGHSSAYLSYTDNIIAIPFEKEFQGKPFDEYEQTLLQVLDALNTLVK